ncbi:hypothetical protein VSDG_06864 [Cytospora chrysosperma]|uniref:Luciferase domain-containing protein n=1 Tax=Cytospora chrysosperma TaxID=252740 RepID=A0A423VQR5_CYTCH|nr:hypothetical protein VSDG_06864 [Valsa sordida]
MATSLSSFFSLPWAAHLRSPKLAATAATLVALAIGLSAPALARSYRGYLALGPGGMPYNVVGWAIQGALQLVARRDTRDPAPFADPRNQGPYEPHGRTSFLGLSLGSGPEGERGPAVPQRGGDRPVVPGYVAPQRQATQQGGEATRERMAAFLGRLAARNPGLLALRPSGLEGAGTPALWLDVGDSQSQSHSHGHGHSHDGNGNGDSDSDGGSGRGIVEVPGYLRGTRGEIAHVHPEASSHVTVSMADAGALVLAGWAERHMLGGSRVGGVPWGYVLVYAPRDEAELEVWRAVVVAGARFVCAASGREVAVPDTEEGDE